jgi:hypothetical protein
LSLPTAASLSSSLPSSNTCVPQLMIMIAPLPAVTARRRSP